MTNSNATNVTPEQAKAAVRAKYPKAFTAWSGDEEDGYPYVAVVAKPLGGALSSTFHEDEDAAWLDAYSRLPLPAPAGESEPQCIHGKGPSERCFVCGPPEIAGSAAMPPASAPPAAQGFEEWWECGRTEEVPNSDFHFTSTAMARQSKKIAAKAWQAALSSQSRAYDLIRQIAENPAINQDWLRREAYEVNKLLHGGSDGR